jgi:hypothetical protein
METLGKGQVEFLYDNQAFVEGPVLIEHGNRYDRWNVIAHDVLRAIRSAISRKEEPTEYQGPAGSQLVVKVMNRLKTKYPFVDLLKPEGAGVLPILAVLDPSSVSDVPELAMLAESTVWVQYDANGIPQDQQNIAGRRVESLKDKQLIKLAFELAGVGDPSNIGGMRTVKDLLARLVSATTDAAKNAVRKVETAALLRAFRAFADVHRESFDVNKEVGEYLKPANVAVDHGFQVIIFGHTHLVKRVDLNRNKAVYLNTGTWADIMRIPEGILNQPHTQAEVDLAAFLKDLEANDLGKWRCQVPTFARVDIESGTVAVAEVYFFDGPSNIHRVPDGQLTRL